MKTTPTKMKYDITENVHIIYVYKYIHKVYTFIYIDIFVMILDF